MASTVSVPLLAHFGALADPRQRAKVLYPLPEILLLVLAASIAGADDFVETALWGTEHLAFLRRFYRYDNGIPSHDTLCDVFAALDPELFKSCFLAWINGLRDDDPDIIAVDGKTSRRSHDRRKGRNPLHLVLGQQATVRPRDVQAIPLAFSMTARAQRIERSHRPTLSPDCRGPHTGCHRPFWSHLPPPYQTNREAADAGIPKPHPGSHTGGRGS